MRRFTKSIDIAAPPERVWAVMTDVERWPEWTPSMTSVRRLDAGPLAVGSRARVEQPRLRAATFIVTAITQAGPRRSFTWRMSAPGVVGVAEHVVEVAAAGARATLAVEFGGILGGVVARLYRGLTERYLTLEAEGLKRRCETGPPG